MTEILETKLGKIKGCKKDGCIKFLGIPFAKPPVGDLTFRYPIEIENFGQEIFDASKGSKNPIQHVGHTGSYNMSEDCLYMNVFVPESADFSEKLPVMVWIFGGSYAEGGAGVENEGQESLIYDFSKLAREKNVVVVTFNYRLNLYGFLNLNFLSDRFDRNIGLFDQIMALRFVKSNIEAFGGNADNVTLFGQSAGGACILCLMGMKEAEPLFHKAIVMSPCVEHFFTEAESEKNTRLYLKYLKIGEKNIDKLFTLTKNQVDEANRKFSNAMRFKKLEMRCAFSPTIDGFTLKDEPKKLAAFSTKPLLIGNVTEEANPFVLSIPTVPLFFMSKIMNINVEKGKSKFKYRVRDAVTKHIYVRPVDEILSEYKGSAWRYLYSFTTPDSEKKGYGCYHFSDVPVLMGKSMRIENVDDEKSQKMGEKLRSIFADFAKSGKADWNEFKNRGEIKEIC